MKKGLFITAILTVCCLLVKAYVAPMFIYQVEQETPCQRWVENTLSHMTLEEKVGQLFIYTVDPVVNTPNEKKILSLIKNNHVGGLLFSGGQASDEAYLTNMAQYYSHIPLMITFDGEWGLSMRLKKLPAFPKNEALGCVRDDNLIYEYGQEMARECHLMGVQVNFAPDADVNRNPFNPVINVRSFGEDPLSVSDKVIAYSQGLESKDVLSVAKHFPGHGDTEVDSHKALPILNFTRQRLDSVELYPFRNYIRAGLGAIMVGHLEVPALEQKDLIASSLSHDIVYDLLTDKMNFGGLIFTDALAMKSVSSDPHVCLRAFQAGNDIVLSPVNITSEIADVVQAVKTGGITYEEIDAKCRKVLTYKYAMGLYKHPYINTAKIYSNINTPEAQQLASRLRLAAITVVGNKGNALPIPPYMNDTINIINVGKHSADSTFVRRVMLYAKVRHYEITPTTTPAQNFAIQQNLNRNDRTIVCVTTDNIQYFTNYITNLSFSMPTLGIDFAPIRTLNIASLPISMVGALVLAHSTDNDVERQVGDILFARGYANGRLSTSIGTIYNAGDGIDMYPTKVETNLPEQTGLNPLILSHIDSIAQSGVTHKAYPGCQVLVMKNSKIVYNRNFGTYTYSSPQHVNSNTMYDLASLSKTTGTLLAVMKLCDQGKLSINDKASKYLPFMDSDDKRDITVRQLLFHESGLPSYLPFYEWAIDDNSYVKPFFTTKKDNDHTRQAGARIWAPTTFSYQKDLVSNNYSPEFPLQVCRNLYLRSDFHTTVMDHIAETQLGPHKYVYSCLNFILLREIVETISGKRLDEFLNAEFFRPMNLKHICYLPLSNKHSVKEIPPTAYNDYLRPGLLQGYVNDEDAAFLGGISGNAGLFADAHDVAQIYQMILNGGNYGGHQYISPLTVRLFTTTTSDVSYRGLGYDKPNIKNQKANSCCKSAPASVFGHTGFTGTCAWVDPQNKMVYVFLSNRTYPNSWNTTLSSLAIRKNIQQTLYNALIKYAPSPTFIY